MNLVFFLFWSYLLHFLNKNQIKIQCNDLCDNVYVYCVKFGAFCMGAIDAQQHKRLKLNNSVCF